MCAIIASFNIHTFNDLYQLNSYRGNLTYSIAKFYNDNLDKIKLNSIKRDKGIMPSLVTDEGMYYLGHSQAPTTQHSYIHPAVYGKAMLWHNGIIKQKQIDKDTWDTEWMLSKIYDFGFKTISDMDGTFACIMYNGSELFVFRNEISPLFYNDDLDFSSTKFKESESLPPNSVFKLELKDKKLIKIAKFTTKENPYYFAEVE